MKGKYSCALVYDTIADLHMRRAEAFASGFALQKLYDALIKICETELSQIEESARRSRHTNDLEEIMHSALSPECGRDAVEYGEIRSANQVPGYSGCE